MRQAYLILAHNNFKALQGLIDSLDCEQTDFYVHIDRKVRALPQLSCSKGRLFVLENRVDVRWGSISLIQAEMGLMEEALRNGSYDFYHIISGTHIALKPAEFINKFFAGKIGQNILNVWPEDEGDADFKLRRIHLFVDSLKYGSPMKRNFACLVWRGGLAIQKMFGLRIHKKNTFIKADEWCSLSENAVRALLNKKRQILKKYRFSFCSDEYFVPSELSADITDCKQLLFTDFTGPSPRELEMKDIEALRNSDYLFARKVSDRLFSQLSRPFVQNE